MAVELQCLFSIGSVLHPSEGGPRCPPNMLEAITGHGDVSAIVILVRSDHWMRCFRIRRGSIREILRLVRACTTKWGAQSFRKRIVPYIGFPIFHFSRDLSEPRGARTDSASKHLETCRQVEKPGSQ